MGLQHPRACRVMLCRVDIEGIGLEEESVQHKIWVYVRNAVVSYKWTSAPFIILLSILLLKTNCNFIHKSVHIVHSCFTYKMLVDL